MTKRAEWYLCGILVLAAVGSFFVVSAPVQADGLFHLYFLDVGQGDAMLMVAPDGTQILIDGGPGQKILDELGSVMPVTDRTIDAVIATHTDADHLSGLVPVLERFEVSTIIETGMACSSAICGRWQEAVAQEQAQHVYVYAGYRMSIGEDLSIEVLNPQTSVLNEHISKTNNSAIVLKISYRQQTILLTADIEKIVEDRLIRESAPIDVDFLKIAHHGSKTSSGQAFLNATSPIAAFIQVGAGNSYGHPNDQVLERLEKISGLQYYRNDRNGRIELVLDGIRYAVTTEQPSN